MSNQVKIAADAMDIAAVAIEASSQGHIPLSGLVLASSFSRLLNRLSKGKGYGEQKTHDVGPYVPTEPDKSDEWRKGLPARESPDPSKGRQIQIESGDLAQFGIISAYRSKFSRNVNRARSNFLLKRINEVLGRPGVYKLFGFYKEETAPEPSLEESFLIFKPESMEMSEFETKMRSLASAVGTGLAPRGDPRKYTEETPGVDDPTDTQDTILMCDGDSVYLLETATGGRTDIGTGFSTVTELEALVTKAYSRMQTKSRKPWVFAGTMQPGDNGGRRLCVAQGIRFFENLTRADYAAMKSAEHYFA